MNYIVVLFLDDYANLYIYIWDVFQFYEYAKLEFRNLYLNCCKI